MYWISENWKPIVAGVFAVGLLGLFYVYSTTSAEAREKEATNALYELQLSETGESTTSASDYDSIASENSSTGIAQHARLRAASKIFEEGNFAEAAQSYTAFVAEFPESPLLPEAFLGIAVSLEAQGSSDDALVKYQEITSRFPQSSVVNRAKVNQARILKSGGETEQAFRIYQELVGQAGSNPYARQSAWSIEAQMALRELLENHPELVQTNTPPALNAASPSLQLPAPAQ